MAFATQGWTVDLYEGRTGVVYVRHITSPIN
jgi:hypothetical protein